MYGLGRMQGRFYGVIKREEAAKGDTFRNNFWITRNENGSAESSIFDP